MTKRKEIVGTGITAREVTRYSGEDIGPAIRTFAERWNASHSKSGGLFGAVTANMMAEVAAIRAATVDETYAADSPEDFAQRIARHHELVAADIKRGAADSAARLAFNLGIIYAQAQMKQDWESHALRGLDLVKGASEGGKQRWQQEGFKRHADALQAAVDRLHASKPHLSYSRLRELIADEFGCSVDTVKRYTKNPKRR